MRLVVMTFSSSKRVTSAVDIGEDASSSVDVGEEPGGNSALPGVLGTTVFIMVVVSVLFACSPDPA